MECYNNRKLYTPTMNPVSKLVKVAGKVRDSSISLAQVRVGPVSLRWVQTSHRCRLQALPSGETLEILPRSSFGTWELLGIPLVHPDQSKDFGSWIFKVS